MCCFCLRYLLLVRLVRLPGNGHEEKLKDNAKDEQQLPVDFGRLNLSDLRARLRARGLSVTGRKQTLIERLETTTATEATTATAAEATTTTTTTATEASTTASTKATSIAATSSNLSPSRPRAQQQQQQLVNYTASSTSASAPQNGR